MARPVYPATQNSYVFAVGGIPQAGIPVRVWSRQTGGTQVTDLVYVAADGTLGAAVPSGILTSDSNGLIPAFAGPDGGATTVWVDSGMSGERLALTCSPGSSTAGVASVVGQTGAVTGTHILADSTVSTALALKAPLASPALTGTPTVNGIALVPGAAVVTIDADGTLTVDGTAVEVGTDAEIAAAIAAGNSAAVATASTNAAAIYAPLVSPALTGNPTAPTATAGDNDASIATTAFTTAAVAVETSRATTAEALAAPKTGATFSGSVIYKGRRPWVDPIALGAVADGSSHPLSGVYGSLGAAQAVYPHATSLAQELDWAALQLAINNMPNNSAVDGGIIAIYGDYYLGADGLVGTRPNVWMLGLAAPSHGAGGSPTARITGNGAGQVLLTLGTTGVTNHRGWRFDNLTFRDVSASNDQIAGAVRLIRFNFNRFFNCDFQSIKSGYAIQLDGTGDTCQYSEFYGCRSRQVLHGIQVVGGVNAAADTIVQGGSWAGTAAAGGIGIQVVSSARVNSANIQGFETGVELDGNLPCVTDMRGDLSGGAVAQYVRVRSTAVDARINNPMFGGTAPSVAHILVDSGANRTRITTPTTNTASLGVSDSGTDTRISGLTGVLTAAVAQTALSNSSTETLIASVTIQSASLRVGSILEYRISGQVDNIATSGALTLRFRIGGISGVTVSQVILPSGTSSASARSFVVAGRVVFRTVGGAATWAASSLGTGGPGTSVSVVPNSSVSGSTISTNTAQDAVVTAQWATADVGNVLRVETAEVALMRP